MAPARHTKRLNQSAVLASLAVAAALVLAKLWAFDATGALSVAASLADSALDLMVSLGGLAAITYAARPPDEDHAFGHTSAEDLASLGQALFILISATMIAGAAIVRVVFADTAPLTDERAGMAVMGLSIVLTLALVLYHRWVAERTGNRVVRGEQLHYLGDLVPNVGALVALWASARFGIGYIDTVVALCAALMLAVGACRIGAGAWHALMDRGADPEMLEEIASIAREWPEVHGFHDLKTRTAGSVVFVNLHIELDGNQSLEDAHAIAAALRRAILERFPMTDVMIHKDVWRPSQTKNGPPHS